MNQQYFYKNNHKLKDIRKFLRANATGAEKILWKYLRRSQLRYKFRRQYSIDNFVADFCCEQIKLVIELDGWTHEGEKIQAKDKQKEQALKAYGYKVVRFTNEQIYGDIEPVLRRIVGVCKAREDEIPRPPPLP